MSAPDLFEQMNEFLYRDGIVNTQDDLRLFLELTRLMAWDIPSALGSICDHMDKEFPMHHYNYEDMTLFNDWEEIEQHFQEVHGFDLGAPYINWSFDT